MAVITWDATEPDGSENANTIDNEIRSAKASLDTKMAAIMADWKNTEDFQPIKIKDAAPAVRLYDSGDASEWRLYNAAGAESQVALQFNEGSEGSPAWTTHFVLGPGVDAEANKGVLGLNPQGGSLGGTIDFYGNKFQRLPYKAGAPTTTECPSTGICFDITNKRLYYNYDDTLYYVALTEA